MKLVARAINQFGDAGPWAEADQESLGDFKKDFVKDCLEDSMSKMSASGQKIAKGILRRFWKRK
jgi:hypothetical protein